MTDEETGLSLAERVGGRVRWRRQQRGDTVKTMANRSGLSARFLADVEAGRANISVARLDDVAAALEVPITSLLRPAAGGPRQTLESLLSRCTEEEIRKLLPLVEVALGRRTPRVIALLGVRGAGKSTVGPPLAKSLGVPFVELAERIEAQAGMALGDIFTLHGEAFYRGLELQCLSELVAVGTACVAALPGGIVGSEPAARLIRTGCTSVWLRASADDYWDRVFSQGDTRPMDGRADPKADLRALVRVRAPLYEAADLVIDTSGVPPRTVVARTLAALESSPLRT